MLAVLLYDRALTQVDSLAKSVTPQASPTERGGGVWGHAQPKFAISKSIILIRKLKWVRNNGFSVRV